MPEFDVTLPYAFSSLWRLYRQLMYLIGQWPTDTIPSAELFAKRDIHIDAVRQLVAWNFLTPLDGEGIPVSPGLSPYETGVSRAVGANYRVTQQARRFVGLELSDTAELEVAILLLLRADRSTETRSGFDAISSLRVIEFFELVMLLDQSENRIEECLKAMHERGCVEAHIQHDDKGRVIKWFTKINLTPLGLSQLIEERTVTYNNINISGGTVGILAIDSILENIDASIGKMSQDADISAAVTQLTEGIDKADVDPERKRELLEQVEAIAEQAARGPEERKVGLVRASWTFLGEGAQTIQSLQDLWGKWGAVIAGFFGL